MLDKQGNNYPAREDCYITVTKTANSNQEWTNLILKKVILPGMGMNAMSQISHEQIGVLWDEFRGHSSAVVKEYCTSLPFLKPVIIPGGLTPVAQPLDKVINKVFKGHFKDLYDNYILTAPIGNTGNPLAPSRQLLSTWVVKAWSMIPEELVRRSWTACGYKSEQDLICSNEGTMVVYDDKQVGAMVEEICGANVRTNFEDVECGPDPFHPSDDECSSSGIKSIDTSSVESSDDDDEIEEIYADPPPPPGRTAQDRMVAQESSDGNDEIEEVYADPPPPARMVQERRVAQDRVNDNRCAAGEHCGMKTTPLHEKAHVCLNCNKKMHGNLCGHLWSERGDNCQIRQKDLTERAREKCKATGVLICFGCTGGT